MTLDEALRAVITAVQPYMHRDDPDTPAVEDLIVEVYKMFDEQSQIREAFVAGVQAIATAARVGYVPK